VHDVLVAVVVIGFSSLALLAAAVLYTRWRLRKQLRLRPKTRSQAPTAWLVSTSEPARLHRRLRRAAAIARSAGARGDSTISGMATELEDHAIALEAHLVALSRVWRRERDGRHHVHTQVVHVEQLASRLSASAVTAAQTRALGAGSPDALRELEERLDALDAARIELAQLEHHWHAS
jgi:hypothetical protein